MRARPGPGEQLRAVAVAATEPPHARKASPRPPHHVLADCSRDLEPQERRGVGRRQEAGGRGGTGPAGATPRRHGRPPPRHRLRPGRRFPRRTPRGALRRTGDCNSTSMTYGSRPRRRGMTQATPCHVTSRHGPPCGALPASAAQARAKPCRGSRPREPARWRSGAGVGNHPRPRRPSSRRWRLGKRGGLACSRRRQWVRRLGTRASP